MITIRLDLTDEQEEALIRRAIVLGYQRESHRKRWSEADRKEAMRYAVEVFAKGGQS
jgi:hypothetical protein